MTFVKFQVIHAAEEPKINLFNFDHTFFQVSLVVSRLVQFDSSTILDLLVELLKLEREWRKA